MKLKSGLKRTAKVIYTALFWICLWEAASLIVNKEILLPSPIDVFLRLCGLMLQKQFYLTVALSLTRILTGYISGIAAGIIFAVITFKSRILRHLLSPAFTVIKATPVASIIILALVWIGKEAVPVLTASLMVIPIIWSNVSAGLEGVSADLLEVAKIYRFSTVKKIRHIYIPSMLSLFAANAKTSLGLAWKAGVAAEVLCTPKFSIGGEIYSSKLYLESADLFAWTLTVIIMSLILEHFISKITIAPMKKPGRKSMDRDICQ